MPLTSGPGRLDGSVRDRDEGRTSMALLLGGAAAGFGLQAAVTKTFVGELGSRTLQVFAHWSVYVLVVSAIVGFALQQGSLKTGVLAPAMASSKAVTVFYRCHLGHGRLRRTARSERWWPYGVGGDRPRRRHRRRRTVGFGGAASPPPKPASNGAASLWRFDRVTSHELGDHDLAAGAPGGPASRHDRPLHPCLGYHSAKINAAAFLIGGSVSLVDRVQCQL